MHQEFYLVRWKCTRNRLIESDEVLITRRLLKFPLKGRNIVARCTSIWKNFSLTRLSTGSPCYFFVIAAVSSVKANLRKIIRLSDWDTALCKSNHRNNQRGIIFRFCRAWPMKYAFVPLKIQFRLSKWLKDTPDATKFPFPSSAR